MENTPQENEHIRKTAGERVDFEPSLEELINFDIKVDRKAADEVDR
jgi:hypothetical protein